MSTARTSGLPPGRWGIVPASWVMHPDLGLDEIGVLACLATYADADGWCWPKQGTIAAHLQRSRPWVIKVINRLVDLGFLDRLRQFGADGGQRPCRYRIRFDRAQPDASVAQDRAASPRSRTDTGRADTGSQTTDSPRHAGDSEQRESKQEESLSPGRGGAMRESDRQPIRTLVPDGWRPSPQDMAWATARFPDIDLPRFTEQFVNSCHANGYRYLDHGRAWRSWLADSPKGNLKGNPKRSLNHAGPAASVVSRGTSPLRPAPFRADGSHADDLGERNREAAGAARRRLFERRAGLLLADGPPA